jgi:hypothetical protein
MHIVLLARVVLVQCYAATSDEALHNYPATKPELAWKPGGLNGSMQHWLGVY